MTSDTARFTLSGEWLTGFVRDQILSDREDAALTVLMDSFEAMTYDIAIDILLGKKRLVGTTGTEEGITLSDETADVQEEWEQELSARYGNRCQLPVSLTSPRQGWFRPVAYITDYGPKDVGCGSARDLALFIRERMWHYADDGEIALSPLLDLAVHYPQIIKSHKWGEVYNALGFIFEPCSAAPVWLRHVVAKNPTAAIQQHLASGRRMEPRGHSDWYPFEPVEPLVAKENVPRTIAHVDTTEQRYQEQRRREVRLAAVVREKAGPIDGDGWFTMTVMPGCPAEYTVRVPRAPFECWSLWRTSGDHLMPQYATVCESGIRLYGDDPYHSDWMLGAFPERDVGEVYRDSDVRDAGYRLKHEVQARLLGFTAAVLSGRGRASGIAIHPEPGDTIPAGSIAILPNARPEYESIVRTAAATIVPVGGELCHLAVVAGEAGRIIMRVEKCLDKYPPGTILEIDTEQGMVRVSGQQVRGAFGSI